MNKFQTLECTNSQTEQEVVDAVSALSASEQVQKEVASAWVGPQASGPEVASAWSILFASRSLVVPPKEVLPIETRISNTSIRGWSGKAKAARGRSSTEVNDQHEAGSCLGCSQPDDRMVPAHLRLPERQGCLSRGEIRC